MFLREKYKKETISVVQRYSLSYSGMQKDKKDADWAPIITGALEFVISFDQKQWKDVHVLCIKYFNSIILQMKLLIIKKSKLKYKRNTPPSLPLPTVEVAHELYFKMFVHWYVTLQNQQMISFWSHCYHNQQQNMSVLIHPPLYRTGDWRSTLQPCRPFSLAAHIQQGQSPRSSHVLKCNGE